MKSSQLAEKIARELSRRIASREMEGGEHLPAQALANSFNVSRSPIREALNILSEAGLVEQKTNRGYYVVEVGRRGDAAVSSAIHEERESPYQRIAEDWRTDKLPQDVSEQLLRDRYGLTKAQVQEAMIRGAREGWVERKPGYGWRFLSVAKSPEAFEQIYRFRMVIEPAAMLSPDYAVDGEKLEELRAAQNRMLDHDIGRQPVEPLLAAGTYFHEELIKFANNPYFHMALVRVNQMRRLLEYASAYTPERFVEQSTQHLTILDLLARGEILEASYAMKKHLGGALTRKTELMRARAGKPVA